MIPSAPAYIGTTQYACIVGLGIFGLGKSELGLDIGQQNVILKDEIFSIFSSSSLIFLFFPNW